MADRDASTGGEGAARREPATGSFAEIPARVRTRLEAGERVLLVLLDAFGLEFLHRYERHPLVRALTVTPLRAQFPSTTTAHITTLAYDQPVEQHGLYEWHILEPSLGRIICPLRYATAESERDGELLAQLPFETLRPGRTFFEQLDLDATVFLPSALVGSPYTQMSSAGAHLSAFDALAQGTERALAELRSGATRYAYLYWPHIDSVGHVYGPGSPQFDAACVQALDALWAVLSKPAAAEVTVLFTADHGQVDVSPDRVDYADVLWPELPEHLTFSRPAGSSRDLFLHVRPDSVARVIDELSVRFAERARVVEARTLFDTVGPRLADRLGQVAVLPAPGREAWLARAPGNERRFLGQHGGLDPVERGTYLARLRSS